MKKIIILLFICAITCILASCDLIAPKHTHSFGDWATEKPATCVEDGILFRSCSECDEKETTKVTKTGLHIEATAPAVDPTCNKTGLTEGKYCIVCKEIFVAQSEIAFTDHTYSNAYDSTCNICGHIGDALCDHSTATVLPSIPSTCTQTGLTEGKHCYRCDNTIVEQELIEPKGHVEGPWVIEVNPTETSDGYKYKACSVCNEKLDHSLIPALGQLGLAYEINPDGFSCKITGIGSFSGTDLFIPEYINGYRVSAIGEKAFSECESLTMIVIPGTVSSIGTRAFYGCTGLTEITIPSSVSSIGTQIFYKAENLSTVYYNSSYSNQNNPFLNLSHIKKVVFGGTIVPSYILYENTNVLEIIMEDSITDIDYYAFTGCSKVTDIVIPNGITYIKGGAFINCSSLTNLTIPPSITYIGGTGGTFGGCTSLKNIYISDLEAWVNMEYSDPSSLPLMYGGNLYLNNELVTKVTIPEGVTSIKRYVFSGCASITEISLPSTLTSIGYAAFSGCSGIKSLVIPSGVTSIESGAFSGCSSLTSITIPDSISIINDNLFSECSALKTVVIPDSVTAIERYAFSGCTSLESIVIPSSVISRYNNSFNNCTSLKDVYYTGSQSEWNNMQIKIDSSYVDNAIGRATVHCNYK